MSGTWTSTSPSSTSPCPGLTGLQAARGGMRAGTPAAEAALHAVDARQRAVLLRVAAGSGASGYVLKSVADRRVPRRRLPRGTARESFALPGRGGACWCAPTTSNGLRSRRTTAPGRVDPTRGRGGQAHCRGPLLEGDRPDAHDQHQDGRAAPERTPWQKRCRNGPNSPATRSGVGLDRAVTLTRQSGTMSWARRLKRVRSCLAVW